MQPSEYDASYFDGASQPTQHSAGYAHYKRYYRHDKTTSQGEYWLDKALEWVNLRQLQGKKVLEIGSAKGFFVEDLRSLGVDAYGLDVSQYAYDQASAAVKPYLTVADVRTALGQYRRNEFDWVISLRTLECFSELEIIVIITELNRISRNQVHVVDEEGNASYYTIKTLSWWLSQPFRKGTIIVSHQTEQHGVV